MLCIFKCHTLHTTKDIIEVDENGFEECTIMAQAKGDGRSSQRLYWKWKNVHRLKRNSGDKPIGLGDGERNAKDNFWGLAYTGGGWVTVPCTKTANTGRGMGCVCLCGLRRRWIRGSVSFMLNIKGLRGIRTHLSLVGSWIDEARALWWVGLLFSIPHSPVIGSYTHTLCHVTLKRLSPVGRAYFPHWSWLWPCNFLWSMLY